MKKSISLIIAILSVFYSYGINDGYTKAMNSTIKTLYESKSIEGYQKCANIFERIANTEKEEWLPLYYASYALVMISYEEQDLSKKDMVLDKAQQFLDQAFAIAPDESELFVLLALLYPSRIMVDPMGRGMEYMGKLEATFEKAKELNPDNPRTYFLEANTILNLPESMGGGKELAKPIFELAEQKFEAFVAESEIHPNWGKEANETELKKLN